MSPSKLLFVTLVLTALGLAPGAAHVLELPVKMQYSPELYTAVTSTLYALFGSVGAVIQVAALLCAGCTAYRSRGKSNFHMTLLGALSLALSLILWGALVAPVNAEWAEVWKATPQLAPNLYSQLRPRWEYGHVAAFLTWFVGYCALQLSALRDHTRTP